MTVSLRFFAFFRMFRGYNKDEHETHENNEFIITSQMFHEISTKRMLDASKLFSCTFRVPPRDIRVIVRMVFVYLVFFVFTGKLKVKS